MLLHYIMLSEEMNLS